MGFKERDARCGILRIGHADGLNDGFLRDEALLIVVFLSDQGDCSATDPQLFDPSSEMYDAELSFRCFEHQEALHPITRYAEGFGAVKDDPQQLIMATLGGIPTDLIGGSLRTMLEDVRMVERKNDAPTKLEISCGGDLGVAFPPRRYLETSLDLEQWGADIVTGLVCEP